MGLQKKIGIVAGLTIFFLVLGTAGYVKLEGYSILDAMYMTVITVSTVGFEEINKLSGVGRIFTMLLILSGVGSVAFAAHALTESLIDRAANPNLRRMAMKKKIEKLKQHTIICGHGRVGAAAAHHFREQDADFVIIEASEAEITILEEKGYHYIFGDATRQQTLLDAGIKKAGAFLALLDSDPENLFTVLTARELNPTLNIIARTDVSTSESRILRAGADSVISPYSAAGKRVADKVLQTGPTTIYNETTEYPQERTESWFRVTSMSELAAQPVAAARTFLGAEIIGIRRADNDFLQPPDDMLLQPEDQLLLSHFGDGKTIESPLRQQRRIVLIDDNPVITRLYTRLFQKAGYHIKTAETGEAGLALLKKERPHAAVVDFMLPDISGLEVCRRIRRDESCDSIRLFLFTANAEEKTRKEALHAGVEMVVVKSPEASEIIRTVQKSLEGARNS